MAELLLELYSEEIPPQLQIGARTQLKEFIESSFKENEIKYKEIIAYSSPTRLVLLANDIAENIKVAAKEIKGPKIGSPCLLYTSPSPRDGSISRMPSSA